MRDFPHWARPISPDWDHLSEGTGGAVGDDSYASFFLAGKFSGFDAAIALAR